MIIADTFVWQGRYFVVCTGEGITYDLSCKALISGGKKYHVKQYEVRNCFSNHFQACFEIEGPELPVPGICEIEI